MSPQSPTDLSRGHRLQVAKPTLKENATNSQACQVLIDNHQVTYHYETLESVMTLYPLPNTSTCNHHNMQFTFLLNHKGNAFQNGRADDWQNYALTIMKAKYQSNRSVKSVVMVEDPNIRIANFDYEIKSSCYCKPDFIRWLRDSNSAFCVFHESCNELADSPQALWLTPHHNRYVLPTVLPEFSYPRPVKEDVVNLCVLGDTLRRNYELMGDYLKLRGPKGLHIHHLGRGPNPEALKGYEQLFSKHITPNFVPYERIFYDVCDVVLGLLTKKTTPAYFDAGKQKLSGSILHAIVYKRPMVLHEELASRFQKHLTDVETHADDGQSFVAAMDRMMGKLRSSKKKIQLINQL